MGVERAVTRWYLHRQLLLNQASEQLTPATDDASVEPSKAIKNEDQRSNAQDKLLKFGPCPKPMMG